MVNSTPLWEIGRELPGLEREMSIGEMTKDGRGHLYVRDYNNQCVHNFDAADGRHMGVVLKKGERGLWRSIGLHWDDVKSALVVVHFKIEYFCSAFNAL